jgi:hypothetical protein
MGHFISAALELTADVANESDRTVRFRFHREEDRQVLLAVLFDHVFDDAVLIVEWLLKFVFGSALLGSHHG